ncbi:OprD family porin [Pseudomonas sp. ML96]|uniref:OprD family porin n=1 Tax=Pseudomonas sp. ML96 TaxID=1523503 RepID=UPI00210BDFC9|nr:OprD family porin [Pseudomonas sp. ML96]
MASGSTSQAFAVDPTTTGTWNLLLRNYYLHNDLRDDAGQQSYQQEWAQGFLGELRSGFTDGMVGVGADVHGFVGIKLDGGRGHAGTGLLPVDSDGRSHNYTSAGGALKLRAGNHLLRYGEMTVETPVFDTGDKRLQPEYATGVMLDSAPSPDLQLQAGRFTRFRNQDGSSGHDDFSGVGASTANSAISLAGVRLFATRDISGAAYISQLDDTWRQVYLNLKASRTGWTLDGNLYRSRDQGAARAGNIETLAYSLLGSYQLEAQNFSLAYQHVDGDTPFDFVGGDSIYLANSVKYSDFNSAGERSWQARYDLNFAAFGVAGLSLMARYVRGYGIDGSHAPADGAYADARLQGGGRHWERDLDLRYTVQQGPVKDLRLSLSYVSHRGNDNQLQRDIDRVYFIIEYPLKGML